MCFQKTYPFAWYVMVDSQCLIKTIKLSVVDMRTRTDLKHFGRCMSHQCRTRFLYLARSKFRLCSANHRLGYRSNLSCDWSSTAPAYSKQETEISRGFHKYFGLNYGVCIFDHASTPIHVRFCHLYCTRYSHQPFLICCERNPLDQTCVN